MTLKDLRIGESAKNNHYAAEAPIRQNFLKMAY